MICLCYMNDVYNMIMVKCWFDELVANREKLRKVKIGFTLIHPPSQCQQLVSEQAFVTSLASLKEILRHNGGKERVIKQWCAYTGYCRLFQLKEQNEGLSEEVLYLGNCYQSTHTIEQERKISCTEGSKEGQHYSLEVPLGWSSQLSEGKCRREHFSKRPMIQVGKGVSEGETRTQKDKSGIRRQAPRRAQTRRGLQ